MKKIISKINFEVMLLIIIAFLSFSSRFYKLETMPQAFFTDEAALGYNGWSLMTTLKDEYGKFLPLTLRSFDDYKPAVYSYLTIPFIAVFGLNQFSSRAPAAMFGALLPIFIYLLVKKITKKPFLAILSALVIVLTPWHLEISRTAIEAGVALSFTIFSLWLLTYKKQKTQFIALFILLITLFTYHTARIISPVIILAAIIFKIIKPTKITTLSIVSIAIFGISLSFTSSVSRFSQISIFSDKESTLLLEEAIREDGGPIKTSLLTTRIVHNKPLYIAQTFAKSYITNTSLSYLFLGGAQPPRVTIPETGQFMLIFLPFFILGIATSIKSLNNFDKWLLFWLVFAPLPASLTTAEIPHTYRTLFMLPPIAIFIGQGILTSIFLIKSIKIPKNLLVKSKLLTISFSIILFLIIGLNSFKSWHQLVVHQQIHHAWHRQFGYKDLISYLNKIENKNKVIVTNRENEPYMAILFFNKIEPKTYQTLTEKRLGHGDIDNGEKGWQMFEYFFSEDPCPYNLQDTNINNYYVVLHTCTTPEGFERVKTINYLDGNPEFHIDKPIMDIHPQESLL